MKTKIKAVVAAIFIILIILSVSVSAAGADLAGRSVYLGGMPFGIKMYTNEITVIGFADVDAAGGPERPAYDAGIRENDKIISVNSKIVKSAADLTRECENCGGNNIIIKCDRDGKTLDFSFTPSLSVSENKYRTGMWIKDSTSGIGTVTYIVPETMSFAGLGHGICNGTTGKLERLVKGDVMSVVINDVKKGAEGAPGELVGTFTDERTGVLVSNTNEGVFGVFGLLPEGADNGDLIKIAGKSDVKEGKAAIRCTLGGNGPEYYDIRLVEIDKTDETNKNFVIEVTDKRLIEKSGGIVQGMSGSPIIQNGRLVGAVTHVFVSDPTKGYGISIAEMDRSMPDILV